jgi:HAD superfamily hydrolase (TIGR01484 family)
MPQFQTITAESFIQARTKLRLVATDMDGTLTQQGQFTPRLMQTLQDLQDARIPVLIVTGRSAGWVSGLVHYLPVAGAIAENGGVFFLKSDPEPFMLQDLPRLSRHRADLADIFERCREQFSQLRESADNRFRLTDWTFDVAGLTLNDLDWLLETCEAADWSFTYSTVQCHIKPRGQDKATALQQVLTKHFPDIQPHQVLTVGDSPNDDSLFDAERFPLSVGVANITHYWQQLRYRPQYVTTAEEVQGFIELSQSLLTAARSRRLPSD